MQKYLDTVLVGVVVFIVVALILALRPGYTPVEVSEEALALTAGEINFEGESTEPEINADAIEDTEGESEVFEAEDQIGDDEEAEIDADAEMDADADAAAETDVDADAEMDVDADAEAEIEAETDADGAAIDDPTEAIVASSSGDNVEVVSVEVEDSDGQPMTITITLEINQPAERTDMVVPENNTLTETD